MPIPSRQKHFWSCARQKHFWSWLFTNIKHGRKGALSYGGDTLFSISIERRLGPGDAGSSCLIVREDLAKQIR